MTQRDAPQRRIKLRGLGQMACLGIIASVIVSLLLGVARGIGFLMVRIEDIPGETLSGLLGFQSPSFDWIVYFTLGAALGVFYHFIFRELDQEGGKAGALLGLAQYLADGILLALIGPFIPDSIQVLPSQPPLSSGMAFLASLWIILLHAFFGWFLGIFAAPNSLHLGLGSEGQSEKLATDEQELQNKRAA